MAMTDLTARWIGGMVLKLRENGYRSALEARQDYEVLEMMLEGGFNPGRLFWTALCVMSGATHADEDWDKASGELWQTVYPEYDRLNADNPAWGACSTCGFIGLVGFEIDSATMTAKRICNQCAIKKVYDHAQLN